MRPHLLIVGLGAYGKDIPFGKSFAGPVVFHTFSSIRYDESGFMWRFVIHSGLSFFFPQGVDLFGFFYMQSSNLINTIC